MFLDSFRKPVDDAPGLAQRGYSPQELAKDTHSQRHSADHLVASPTATSGRSMQTGGLSYGKKRRFGETSPTTRDGCTKLRRTAPAATEKPANVVIDLTAYSSDDGGAESADSDCILITERPPSPLKRDATEPGTINHASNVMARTEHDLLSAYSDGRTHVTCFRTNDVSSHESSGPIGSNHGPWRGSMASKSHSLDATGARRLANSASPSHFTTLAWRAQLPSITSWNSAMPKHPVLSRTHTNIPNFTAPSAIPCSSRPNLQTRKMSRRSNSGCHQPKNLNLGPPVTEKELDDLLKNISPDDGSKTGHHPTPSGLKSPLYRHQEVALAWMKKMETGPNKGGILADDMGLGKTISALALILVRSNECRPKVIAVQSRLADVCR